MGFLLWLSRVGEFLFDETADQLEQLLAIERRNLWPNQMQFAVARRGGMGRLDMVKLPDCVDYALDSPLETGRSS
jgi:hypothetical protein